MNAASDPIAPRLLPVTRRRGRRPGGSADHASYTRSKRTRPATSAFSWSVRKEIQLGR
ncbi:MAG TPA: hypothetical protein VF049_08935 [Nocardioidaceae bacterium]